MASLESKVKKKIEAFILAGGSSRRMGMNKALLPLGKACLIRIIQDRLSPLFLNTALSVGDASSFGELGMTCIPDRISGFGAVEGIRACLEASSTYHSFFIACDMPFVNPDLVRYLAGLREGYDVVVPRRGRMIEPLLGVYSKTCIEPIQRQIDEGVRKIIRFYKDVRVRYVEEDEIRAFDPLFLSFVNINTPEDYEAAKKFLEEPTRGG